MDKPREFWVVDYWDPVKATRVTFDNDPLIQPSENADVFHVREITPEDESLRAKLDIAVKALEWIQANTGHSQLCSGQQLKDCWSGCDVAIKAKEGLGYHVVLSKEKE